VATAAQGRTRIIERATGQRLLPSMVGITADGERVVGEEARQLAETYPENVAYSTKRFIGQRWTPELAQQARLHYPFSLISGPNEDVRVKLGERSLPVTQIAAMVLSALRADAEAHFGQAVVPTVLTVPAAFTDAQRQATREAAAIAGLEVLRLVNEPTAAAMAYGLATGFNGNAMVFDLGGGTFDVSILSVKDGVFEVVATGGDVFFGGEDFDNVLVQWLQSHVTDEATRERIAHDRRAIQKLKAVAEQAKKTISTTERAHISAVLIPDTPAMRGVTIETMLTRDFFEKLVRPKTEHCLSIVERTMKEANLEAGALNAVLLVGGMTRVPLLRSLVIERFGAVPEVEVNPEEAVALGAAMHAAELVEKRGQTLLLDVVGSSLGVGIAGGLVKPLIRKNSMLPCTAHETFYPGRDQQVLVRVPVVQGEARLAADNAVLGELKLELHQPLLRSDSPIEVTFSLNQEGLLSVSAVDARSGQSEVVHIAARPALVKPEAERLATAEVAHRSEVAAMPSGVREQNRHARQTLRQVMDELRRLHREISVAAAETTEGDAKEVAERLGHRLVDAELVESSGTPEQVLEQAAKLVELLEQVSGGTRG
jgi:molecular chaperone DnaK